MTTVDTSQTFQYDTPGAYDIDQPYDGYVVPTLVAVPVVIPHLSAVLDLNPDGSFAWLQQGTIDEVSQSVEMIVGTPKGQRTMIPAFGISDPTFLYPVNKNEILQALSQYEPRAQTSVDISYNSNGESDVRIAVALVRGSTV